MNSINCDLLQADDLAQFGSTSSKAATTGNRLSHILDDDLAVGYRESYRSRPSNVTKTERADRHSGGESASVSGLTGKRFIALTGSLGGALVASLTLAAVWIFAADVPRDFVTTLLTLLITRLLYVLFRPSRPILGIPVMHRKQKTLFTDEAVQSLLFFAACFFVSIPAHRLDLLAFAALNLASQSAMLRLSKLWLKRIALGLDREAKAACSKRTLIVGSGKRAREIVDMILDCPELDTQIIGLLDYSRRGLWRYRDIPLVGHPDKIESIASREHIDAVILAVDLADMSKTHDLFSTAEKMGLPLCFMPDLFHGEIATARTAHLNGFPAILYRAVPENRLTLLIKSAIDRLGALVGITVAAPLMLAVAAAIKLDSRGPVLFKQTRSGLNGRKFDFLKFRTMCDDAEQKKDMLKQMNEMSGPVFKIRKDPRITRIGRVLRRYSIDELPQLFNVLAGQMSLVGPRPPLPSEVAQYAPWQRRKLSVKPGLTCLWQVNGRNRIDFEDWMKLDLKYIDNWSLWLDMRILARTLPAVVRGDGAS